jgi:hypothetical protein
VSFVTKRRSANGAPSTKKKFTSWSYSRFSDYAKCALYAYLKHIEKVPEPKGPALTRGSEIDELCTKYASGEIGDCPPELARFKSDFDALRKVRRRLYLQQEIAFTKDWEETDWKDWDHAWVRVKMDCYYEEKDAIRVVDFKTGRIYPGNEDQLDLYAVAAILKASPKVKRVEAELWYLDQDGENVICKSYTREEALALREKWSKTVRPMLNDGVFKPTPSEYACKYCFFSQAAKKDPRKNGPGLCKF